MDRWSGRAAGRPRRLRIWTDRPSAAPASTRRRGAGDGRPATAVDRHRQARVGLPSAATCRRRRARASMLLAGQASTPAKPPLANNCSQHQAASRPARMSSKRSGTTPAAAQAGACGCQGGSIRASQPPACDKVARAGSSKLISPWPQRSTRISVRFPCGQPPPGNSASRAAWPLAMAFSGRPGSASPRQMSPLASTSARGNGTALMRSC